MTDWNMELPVETVQGDSGPGSGSSPAAPKDRQSLEHARRVGESMYTEEEARAVLSLLARTIREAHRVGPSSWELTLFPNYFRLNVGFVWAFTGRFGVVYFLVDTRALNDTEAEELSRLAAIEAPGDLRTLPTGAAVAVEKGRVAALASSTAFPHLLNAHFQALHEAAKRCPTAPRRSAHSPGLVRFKRTFLGVDLPDPAYMASDPVLDSLAELREAFHRFQESALNRFRVEVRRSLNHRAFRGLSFSS